MAVGRVRNLKCVFSRLSTFVTQRQFEAVTTVPTRAKSTLTGPRDDLNCKVEIGVTSDGKTVVCYHPPIDVPYELTQPIANAFMDTTPDLSANRTKPLPRPDPLTNPAETHEQVLKAHLSKEVLRDKQGPTIEELSKMFFTTKHRWYPHGQYHTRRRNRNPPKDR